MPRTPASEADRQLITHAARHGPVVTARQLERWRARGLLAPNIQRALGRGRGSASEPAAGAAELVVWLAKMHALPPTRRPRAARVRRRTGRIRADRPCRIRRSSHQHLAARRGQHATRGPHRKMSLTRLWLSDSGSRWCRPGSGASTTISRGVAWTDPSPSSPRWTRALGYDGSYPVVRDYLARNGPARSRCHRPRPTVRDVTNWLCRRPGTLTEDEKPCLKAILGGRPEL
jgi:hypothetical protein